MKHFIIGAALLAIVGGVGLAVHAAPGTVYTYSSPCQTGELDIGGGLCRTITLRSTTAPVLANAGNTVTFTYGSVPPVVDGGITVSCSGCTSVTGATATISAGFLSKDALSATVSGTSIAASYNSTTGVLTLSGADTLSHYQTVLRSIVYQSLANDPTNAGADIHRTIQWVASNGGASSAPITSTVNISFPTPNVTLTATIGAATIATIAPKFTGFSVEKGDMSLANVLDPTTTSLVNVFNTLGPGVLRIGGNSVDYTVWNPTGAGLTANETGPPDVVRLANFVAACPGWVVLYGIDFIAGSPSLAASEATYVNAHMGSNVRAYEIGNEPDYYVGGGLEPPTWTIADFENGWESFRTAMIAAVPSAKFAAPATTGYRVADLFSFAAAKGSEMFQLTGHSYTGGSRDIPNLLANGYPSVKSLDDLNNASSSMTGGYALAETNSYNNGGQANVSNTGATALWAIQYSFSAAYGGNNQVGPVGINWHGSLRYTGIPYNWFDRLSNNTIAPRPLIYGILFFSQVHGTLFNLTQGGTATATFVFASQESDGTYDVALVNSSDTESAAATVTLPASVVSANARILYCPTIESTSGCVYGGSAYNPDGTWVAATVYNQPNINTNIIHFNVPPASAVLIKGK